MLAAGFDNGGRRSLAAVYKDLGDTAGRHTSGS